MLTDILIVFAIPFLGTALGSACVFAVRKELHPLFRKSMNGFAAGIMIAASVWSLIIPALELAESAALPPLIPAALGLWLGIALFYAVDKLLFSKQYTILIDKKHTKNLLPIIAVAVHNIPEGMALGVVFAAYLSGSELISYTSVIALALGIGIQNFPEGAAISLPLRQEGLSRRRAFSAGAMSGVVEPVFGVLAALFAAIAAPLLPWLLSFAAGAMLYVVAEELIPQAHSRTGTCAFLMGFLLMMTLDTALG